MQIKKHSKMIKRVDEMKKKKIWKRKSLQHPVFPSGLPSKP